MKKLSWIVLVLILAISLVACGNDEGSAGKDTGENKKTVGLRCPQSPLRDG